MREFRGWIKDWRQANVDDMYKMEPHTYKLWRLLLSLAQHKPFRDLAPGELRTTYHELREWLRTRSGKTYSQHTILLCLGELVCNGYITVLSRRRGQGMKIRIERWKEMQGEFPEGYEFARYDYPPAAD